jgi:hypothetical protein
MSVFQRGTRKIGCRRRTSFCSCGVFIVKALFGSGRSALLKVQPLHASSITCLRSSLVSIASPPLRVLTYIDGGIKGCEVVLRDAQFIQNLFRISSPLAFFEKRRWDALCDGETRNRPQMLAQFVRHGGAGFILNGCLLRLVPVLVQCLRRSPGEREAGIVFQARHRDRPINRERANAKQSGQPEGQPLPLAACGAGAFAQVAKKLEA